MSAENYNLLSSRDMSLLAAWMPAYDVAARYAVQIAAPPEQVWASLLATGLIRHAILTQVRREAQARVRNQESSPSQRS